MKILHIEAGRHLYGGAKQVLHLLEGLAQRGHENVLVCPGQAEYVQQARRFSRVIPMPMGGDLDIGLYGRLVRTVRETQPALMHAHSRRGADFYPGLCARRLDIPAVLSRRVDNREPAWLARLRARLFDRVIVISEAIGLVQRSLGVPADKLVCIRDAIDAEPFMHSMPKRAWRKLQGLPENALVVGMVAQFIPRKGHRVLLESLEHLLPRHPELHVALFGRGPLEAEIQADVRARGWEQRVHFMGFVDDLAQQLGALDLMVHPAAAEGLGVSLLQGAAAGLPIVGTDAGGIPEAVQAGVTGLIVPSGRADALELALHTLLGNVQMRSEMGAAGRARVVKNFSVENMVQAHIALYQTLMESRHVSG